MRRIHLVLTVAAMMITAGPAKADISIGNGGSSFGGSGFSSGGNSTNFNSGLNVVQSNNHVGGFFGDDDSDDISFSSLGGLDFGNDIGNDIDGFGSDNGDDVSLIFG